MFIRFEEWLVGLLTLNGPPLTLVAPTFFCACVYLIVNFNFHPRYGLLQLIVVAYHAFCVYHHPLGHQPDSWAHGEVESHLCLVNGKLVSLNRLCKVRLLYSVFHQHKELALRLLCAAACAKYATSHVHLQTKNTVNKSLYRLVYSRKSCLGQPFGQNQSASSSGFKRCTISHALSRSRGPVPEPTTKSCAFSG